MRWLLHLQTDFVDPEIPPPIDLSQKTSNAEAPTGEESEEDTEDQQLKAKLSSNEPLPTTLNPKPEQQQQQQPSSELHQSPDKSTMWSSSSTPSIPSLLSTNPTAALPALQTPHATQNHPPPSAFCGRPCKPADTCYAFWAGASLHLLSSSSLAATPALRSYLLELTQHPIMGGFSKFPGDKWADLYHSYLGLVALSLASSEEERKGDGVKGVDAGMCVSVDVRGRLEGVWRGWE